MTLQAAQTQARKRARMMGKCYYVLGPCPTDGYWTVPARLRLGLAIGLTVSLVLYALVMSWAWIGADRG